MNTLQSRISYLRGLAEGMELSESSKEGKILTEILNVLEDMSDSILDLEDEHDELEGYIETIDEDLNDLEEEFYMDDEDCECGCDCDDSYLEVECPNCNDSVCIDTDILENSDCEITCPNCDEVVLKTNDDVKEK